MFIILRKKDNFLSINKNEPLSFNSSFLFHIIKHENFHFEIFINFYTFDNILIFISSSNCPNCDIRSISSIKKGCK